MQLGTILSPNVWKAAREVVKQTEMKKAWLDMDHQDAIRENRQRELAKKGGR